MKKPPKILIFALTAMLCVVFVSFIDLHGHSLDAKQEAAEAFNHCVKFFYETTGIRGFC